MFVLLPLLVSDVAKGEEKKPPPKKIDYEQISKEATDLLVKYIQVNTTNPPGNEIAAARLLKEKLLADGVPAAVFESEPGRGIVAARLKGVGRKRKALILLSHMDVVPADPGEWQVPPFSGTVKNGEIWGRGALDDKGPGVVELMAMLAIKRAGILLQRDILFLATADEEEGGRLGAGWVAEHQPDLYSDAGFVLNEGGGIRVEENGTKLYAVAVTEKSPLWIRLSASGASGHGSTPPEQTAVTHLIRALGKLADYRAPVKIVPAVEQYFRSRAELDHGEKQTADLKKALKDPAFVKQFLAVPAQAAMVRNTLTPTVLSASLKTNVIPASAQAELDCRLLPGEDPKAFIKVLRELIDDDTIKVEEVLSFASGSSPEKSDLMNAIRKLARDDQKAVVIPTMLTGFTDCHYFRQKGLIAYGFEPIEGSAEEARTVHGANERISIKSLRQGIEKTVELLMLFDAS